MEDQHGKPYFYNPEDSSVQWELPQVTSLGREIAGEEWGGGMDRMISDYVSLPRSRSLPPEVSANPARIATLQPRLALQRRRWEGAMESGVGDRSNIVLLLCKTQSRENREALE